MMMNEVIQLITNREHYKNITDINTLLDLSVDNGRCEACDKNINKNLSPYMPCCEGRWCEEALEYWLDEEYRED